VGEYQFYDFASRDLFEPKGYPDAYQLGLAASWNLFDGGASLAKEKEAGEERKQADAAAEEAKLQAPYDFDFWKRRLGYSAALYRARLAEVDKAKESVRLSRLGFKAGTRTTTDVLDSELDYFRATAGVVAAQVEAAEALMNVELAVGKRIGHE
jgi:OMF family outer membrane factor